MKHLPTPKFDAKTVSQSCVANIQDRDLASRVNLSIPQIEESERAYLRNGSALSWFLLPSQQEPFGTVTGNELKKLYKNNLSKFGSSSRHYYDKIKLSPPHGICPLCNQRMVKTLDHYLSQKHFPAYSLTPVNLVPSCSDCNKAKLDRLANAAEEQTLHPYFDEAASFCWISANVIEAALPQVTFKADPPCDIKPTLARRLIKHFEVFGLAELYAAQAGVELAGIGQILGETLRICGSSGVHTYLVSQARSRSTADQNTWQAALYVALSESIWFCEIGCARLSVGR